ncbi:MAG: polyhydroxyalkanoate depolymerase [Betaproteobacteria bacterium]|jgi:polyhydroxyalkanoate depolymerase|nr:polyhydroxyalkanoate depolymerase [Betaproteobacteria bacterium]
MMMYQAYQSHSDLTLPMKEWARRMAPLLHGAGFGFRQWALMRGAAAACEVLALARITHHRPPFRIDSIQAAGHELAVTEEVVLSTPFATLLRFRKDSDVVQPRVLLVAPMSGHFATLLRDTARTMLPEHDVYITDWHNARDVPLSAGPFGLDEYVGHIVEFLEAMGPAAHVVAVCQPCVAALAAVAIMSEDDHPATPRSLTLMAGPVDCRINPTRVNELATSKPMAWFEKNLISPVPLRHPGARRLVYPGFLQLTAFMNMNLERHITSFRSLYDDIVKGDFARAHATRTFYEEYFAVADLPAEFYLETVRDVFQEYALARGTLMVGGRLVDPKAIRRTALVTIEGEKDDICALGQTLAAQDLCSSLRQYLRTHYVQPGAGHYGVFSGSRWKNSIYPIVRDVIQPASQARR